VLATGGGICEDLPHCKSLCTRKLKIVTPELRLLFTSVPPPNAMANANAPALPRYSSQTSLTSDSYDTAPSVAESSSANGTSAAPLVDLNPSIPNPATQQSSSPSASGSDGTVVSEKRKCWICLAEEDEPLPNGNDANTSRWTKPCACSLDAHESCLITWVNQSRGGDTTAVVRSPLLHSFPLK